MVFGETLADTVDVEAQLPRMLLRVRSIMKAGEACLDRRTAAVVLDWQAATRARMRPGSRSRRFERWPRGPLWWSGRGGRARPSTTTPSTQSASPPPPSKRAGEASGALVVFGHDRRFDAEDVALLGLAGQLALVSQNAEMLQHLESSYFSTVTALASAVEAKNGHTADHCRLIAGMAELVGRCMGQSEADLRLLRYAAILHDIGKSGVPGSVLRSPAPLTDEESALIADHTVNGASIVARIQYLSPVAPIIRAAHERWDGAGYPDRLRGDEILWRPASSSSSATPVMPWCLTGRIARP